MDRPELPGGGARVRREDPLDDRYRRRRPCPRRGNHRSRRMADLRPEGQERHPQRGRYDPARTDQRRLRGRQEAFRFREADPFQSGSRKRQHFRGGHVRQRGHFRQDQTQRRRHRHAGFHRRRRPEEDDRDHRLHGRQRDRPQRRGRRQRGDRGQIL